MIKRIISILPILTMISSIVFADAIQFDRKTRETRTLARHFVNEEKLYSHISVQQIFATTFQYSLLALLIVCIIKIIISIIKDKKGKLLVANKIFDVLSILLIITVVVSFIGILCIDSSITLDLEPYNKAVGGGSGYEVKTTYWYQNPSSIALVVVLCVMIIALAVVIIKTIKSRIKQKSINKKNDKDD